MDHQATQEQVDELIRQLFTNDKVTVFDHFRNALPRVSEVLKKDNVRVRRLLLCIDNQLSISIAETLRDALKVNMYLEEIDFAGPSEQLAVLLEGVAHSQNIIHLKLRSYLRAGDTLAAAGLVRLERLYIRYSIHETEVLGNEGVVALSKALNESLGRLKELTLFRCGMDSHGAAAIARALRKNSTLEVLNIFYDNCISDEGADTLAAALSSDNTTLKELRLERCGIATPGAIALASFIRQSNSIQVLSLLRNPAISVQGIQALADACSSNVSLVRIDLDRGNPLKDSVSDQINLNMNRFRKRYLEHDHATISPALYPHVFAQVSKKPSALFLFLQETRGMFIPHLPEAVF
jgi:hypothetical protein